MKNERKTLVLIDGKSVFYRGFYAMPNLTTKDGTPTGGVYGFAVLALELFSRIQPDYVAVAWDKPKTNIRRRLAIYDKYKGNRHAAPPEFYAQIPLLRELLDALNWPFYEVDDYEADDIIGTFDLQAEEKGVRAIMISSDLDLLQLVDDNTELYALKKGLSNLERFDVEHFREKYGVEISQFADLKALKGDASDNIPGVPGVGEKTAVDLLQKFGTLDQVFAKYTGSDEVKPAVKKKLEAGEKSARMSRELVEIFRDAPLTLDFAKADSRNVDAQKLRETLLKFEFGSLLRKLPDFMREETNFAEAEMAEIREFSVGKMDEKVRENFAKSETIFVAMADEKETENTAKNAQGNLLDAAEKSDENDEKYLIISDEDFAKNGKSFRISLADFAKDFSQKKVAIHDAKTFAKMLLDAGFDAEFTVEFDTRIASFLLNSLRKSPELSDAVNFAKTDENGDVRAMTDGEKIGATVELFRGKSEELSRNLRLEKLAKNVDFPFQILLAKIEKRGVKLDVKMLREMSKNLGEQIAKIEDEVRGFAGEDFNVSSPKQLSEIMFEKMNFPTFGIKKSARGYSTGVKEFAKLRETLAKNDDEISRKNLEFLDKITEIREKLKLKNTYVDALPNLVDDRSYLHTTLRQDVTATGRLSSSNPNLQNIPTRTAEGKEIRRAFVAENGKILLSADYSQFELRLAAALSHDENMIKVFAKDDADIHTETAAEAFGIAPENVTKNQRRSAKVINFGILYGMSPHGLSAATGMNFRESQDFIAKYFEIRKPVREFLDATMKQADDEGFVETLFGRQRPTPDVRSSNFAVREAAKRAAANMPIQGTEADLMKMAMLEVEKELPNLQFMQIHDSIMVECAPEDADEVSRKLVKIMENIYPELGVKLKADVKCGTSWAEL